jgi:hypothetical protein
VDHTRHMNIFQVPEDFSVTLIGAGGIGATTALTLAKMGVRTMVMYDDDTVGHETIPTQLHRVSDVGIEKVDSLELTLREYSDELTYIGHCARVTENDVLRSSLVISAVDNISARQGIWKALNNLDSAWDFYLDSRMAAEEYQHFLVECADVAAMAVYNKHLMSMTEDSAPDLPCTMKATFFTSMISAGHIGAQLRNIVRGEAHSHRLVHNIPANWLQQVQL